MMRKVDRKKTAERREGSAAASVTPVRSELPRSEVVEVVWRDIDMEDRTHEFRIMPIVVDLKKSLEAFGQQVPVMLRGSAPPFQIVCGFRRITALRELGAATVKAIVRGDLTDDQAFSLSFLENEERHNLSDLDRANIVGRLRDHGKTQEQIAEILGRSRRQIIRYAKILAFPVEIRIAVAERKISAAHGLTINAALEKGVDLKIGPLIREIQSEKMSVSELSKRLRALLKEKRKGRHDRYFQKRGDGFSVRSFTYNPKTATPEDTENMIKALTAALDLLRGSIA